MRSELAERFIEGARKAGFVETTLIGENCKIDPSVVMGENCVIGDNTIIRENVILGDNVTICENCIIGDTPTVWGTQSADDEVFNKKLIIEDGVTIKSFTIIERGGLTDASRIGKNTDIGSFCYIAHDAQIGEDCLIFPYVFFCGSVTLHNKVVVLSHATLFNDVVLGDATTIFHGTNVFKSTEPEARIIGQYGDTLKEYCKKKNFLKCSSKTLQRIKNLEDAVNGKDSREHQETVQQG